MSTRRKKKGKLPIFGAIAIVAMLGTGAMAFTASNTVQATKAGQGSGAISGYVTSSLHYGLNATDPRTIDSLTFTLDSAPVAGSTIRAQLINGGTWFTCSNTGTSVSCPSSGTLGVGAAAVDQLTVVVAQ